MTRATGLLLVILGAWLMVATLAGRLPERVLAAAFGALTPGNVAGEGGSFTGGGADQRPPGGGGGGGGGAW